MSVVVAIKENNKIYIGADSQVTRGGTRKTLNNKNNYKVWKVKNVDNCLMASVGDLRDATVVRLMNNLVSDYEVFKGYVGFEFVVKSVVPDIFNELKKYGYMKDQQYIEPINSEFIFAFQNQLFLISGDGSVIEIDDCVSIGSGKCEAIGSLLSTEGQTPEERIIKAIKASAANDIYVDYPIILSNTGNTKFAVVTEKNEQDFIKKIKTSSKEKKPTRIIDRPQEDDVEDLEFDEGGDF